MLPIPAASTTLDNMLVTSQPVFNAFMPYGYMEIGIIIAVVIVIFIIGIFSHAFEVLLGRGFYAKDVATGRPTYQKYQ